MTPPGKAIPAMPARDVTLADNKIAAREPFHVIPGKIDNSHKFVADGHGYWNRFLRPRVPIIYVHVGAADGGLQDSDEHVVAADFRNRKFFEPQSRLGPAFHHGLHHFLHDKKLGEAVYEVECDGVPDSPRESATHLRLRLIRSLGMMQMHVRNP
jgi:hypothetical protein